MPLFLAFAVLCRLEGGGGFLEVDSLKVWLVKGGERAEVSEWDGSFARLTIPPPEEVEEKRALFEAVLWLSGAEADTFEGTLPELERFLVASGVGYELDYSPPPEVENCLVAWWPIWPWEGELGSELLYEVQEAASEPIPSISWSPAVINGKVFCPFGGAPDPRGLPGIGRFRLIIGVVHYSRAWAALPSVSEVGPRPGRRVTFIVKRLFRTDHYLAWDTLVLSWPVRNPTVCDVVKIRELTARMVWHPPDSGAEVAVWPGVSLPGVPWHRWVCRCGEGVITSEPWEGVEARDTVMWCHLERADK